MSKQGFVSIHGKEYETVASRVNRFREKYPEYTIKTTIIKIDADECIVEAGILNEESRLIANGHAQEFRANSQINKTSYVENCETSAIGRALAAFGIGGTEFASANEVVNAIHQQNAPVKLEPVEFYVDKIRAAKTMTELTSLFNTASLKTKSNPSYLPIIRAAASEMKALFEGMTA